MKGDEIIEFEEGWNIIQKGIQKLKNVLEGLSESRFTSYDFMMTYSTIYIMCTQKHPHDYSSQLYEKYKESIQDYILSSVLPSLREKQEEFTLREVVNRWENHKLMVRFLSHFFRYLDRFYIYRARVSSLETLGFMRFRDLVYEEAIAKVRDAVASFIDREREGEHIDVNAEVKKAFVALTEMRMATVRDWYGDFEAAMLERTSVYYSQKASNWIPLYSFSDYVLKAEECLKRERDRVAPYFCSCSKPKLLEKVQQEIYPKQLLDRELSKCHAFVGNDKIDYLSESFTLFSKVPQGLEHIASIFKEHVTTKGLALVKQTEDAASNNKANNVISLQQQVIIKEVIELHDRYLEYVKDNFSNHGLFLKALMCAFEVFCDKGIAGSSIAELLVTFCDNILKKGGTKLSDEIIEETLEKVVKLISCISDKDLWAELYRKKLANRLLFNKSANYDHERSFLTKLKLQFGGLFTSKMEGMVRDMMLAKEDQAKFEEYLSNSPNADSGIDFTVTVLTTGFWPSYKSFNLNLPREMMRIVESFEEFYLTKTKHRKLRWIHSLGSCNMSRNFETKTMELIVTPYQASALLLFNSSDRLSYSEIKTNLSLSDNDVTRLLHSLSCGKYKILNKEPNTEKISPTDYFEFNSKFTDPMRMVKIPLPSLGNDKKKVIEEVDEDRRYALDATIVRIMKSRRVLGHQQLLTECVQQLSTMFKPNAKAIKQRIENLIFREYLERDTDDLNLLRYLE